MRVFNRPRADSFNQLINADVCFGGNLFQSRCNLGVQTQLNTRLLGRLFLFASRHAVKFTVISYGVNNDFFIVTSQADCCSIRPGRAAAAARNPACRRGPSRPQPPLPPTRIDGVNPHRSRSLGVLDPRYVARDTQKPTQAGQQQTKSHWPQTIQTPFFAGPALRHPHLHGVGRGIEALGIGCGRIRYWYQAKKERACDANFMPGVDNLLK